MNYIKKNIFSPFISHIFGLRTSKQVFYALFPVTLYEFARTLVAGLRGDINYPINV